LTVGVASISVVDRFAEIINTRDASVIARLARIRHIVSAALDLAGSVAAVSRGVVSVVALLWAARITLQCSITAELKLAGCVAAIVVQKISVFAALRAIGI
jgi:hypothetical protein